MKIKLKQEWMGNQKGSIVNTMQNLALGLIKRGIAVEIEENKTPIKRVVRPEKNKMVETSINK
jgi:hypothetical protein